MNPYQIKHSNEVFAGQWPPVPENLWKGWYVVVEDGEPMHGPHPTRMDAEDVADDLYEQDLAALGARLLGVAEHKPEQVK